jgi:hypothetical protein
MIATNGTPQEVVAHVIQDHVAGVRANLGKPTVVQILKSIQHVTSAIPLSRTLQANGLMLINGTTGDTNIYPR